MIINKIILKEHKTKRSQYFVPRIFWLWCQLSFRESSTTSDLSQLFTLGGDSIISALCLCDIAVCSLKFMTLRDWHARRFLISPVDIKTQTKNPRKRNSPLNTCVGGIRLEGCMLYLIFATCCIARASCIHALHIVHASY